MQKEDKYASVKEEITVGKTAPNLLNRDFHAEKPNQKWVTDQTGTDRISGLLHQPQDQGKAKGLAACNSQTASPFGCLNNFYFKILSNFWGSLQSLLAAYREQTGDMGEPLVVGGGTYARAMKDIVAFGPGRPGRASTEHETDEHLPVEKLLRLREIYRAAPSGLTRLAESNSFFKERQKNCCENGARPI